MRRVVITGIGALTPIGNTYSEYKQSLKNGVSGADMITKFDATHFKVKFACGIKNPDFDHIIPKKEARRMESFATYAMITAHEAMAMSGLDVEKIDLDKAAVVWGSGIGGFETIEHDIEEAALWKGEPRYSPF